MPKEQRACGSWPSAISADMVAANAIRYGDVQLDGDDIVWLEGRPQEQGRSVIVRLSQGETTDLLPAPYNARSRVHEYGGGAYTVHEGRVWFVNDKDQQVHVLHEGNIEQLTRESACRFADLQYDPLHDCLYAVREDNRDGSRHEPVNGLVRIKNGQVDAIASGHDFFAAPRLSPDGEWLAWLSWDHPNMPWDETTLWLARVTESGEIESPQSVINASQQAVFQPEWSPDGRLYFVNDPGGWWQLYRLNDCADIHSVEQVCDLELEMGLPLWQFGMRSYAFQDSDRIVATVCEQGLWRLVKLCANTGELEPIASPYNGFTSLSANRDRAVVIAAGARCTDEVASVELKTAQWQSCLADHTLPVDSSWLSIADAITFPTSHGDEAHGFYYPPHHPDVEPLADEQPPLLVMTHGGPTGATSASLNIKTQYWTSRGFAVLDINYRGSTGYGRAYREKLKGQWGVYDVEDVVAGARYLVSRGKADGERLAIRGGSAGGYTTLAALAFTDTFAAGASYYGIGDLQSLAQDTHKFEARYLDRLVGKLPQDQQVYDARSPLKHVAGLSCPVIFLQGEEDRVVPPRQAQQMTDALKDKGVDVELRMYAGEQHGFRRAETIIDTLQSELAFYARVFKFDVRTESGS